MKLKTVRVTNFRAVDDSELFDIDQVTCLVGKNEAGKSAILTALAALNPHTSTPAIFDKERDYPRSNLMDYEAKHGNEEAVAITTTWELSEAELKAISDKVGQGVIANPIVAVSRRYGKQISIDVKPDLSVAIEYLYSKFKLDASERSVLHGITTSSNLIEHLRKLSSPTAKHTELKAYLDKNGSVTAQVQNLIAEMIPAFMYFSAYDRMDGAIQLEQTQTLINSRQIDQELYRGVKLFAEFLNFAGAPLSEINKVKTYETFNARLQAASNKITDQILEYWTQNPDLSVVVKVEQSKPGDPEPLNSGTIARARIYNSLHRVDTPFSERSAGFVWFFSFLVKFAQVKDEETPVILLLDEPGLTLHGKAQADLLRYFKEKLAPHHQIVYSTHSPFMVPADELLSVRIVEDIVDRSGRRPIPHGTKVRSDVLTRDPDTLFPLQGALGYEITQSLFVGKHTLLVEGPGDILYLQALSEALRHRGRTGLDQRWTLCPAGGIDKIKPFVALFAGNTLHVAALSDQAAADKKKLDDLRKSQVLKAGHFFTVADILDRPEADIEDLFDPERFSAIVNGCYGLADTLMLTADKLAAEASSIRLLKKAEALFSVMPPDAPLFDHFAPAAHLVRNPKLLDGDSTAVQVTLDNAEKVFKTFNALLQ